MERKVEKVTANRMEESRRKTPMSEEDTKAMRPGIGTMTSNQ